MKVANLNKQVLPYHQGFTLIEFIIVVLLLVALIGLGVPRLLNFMQRVRVDALSKELIASFNYAKSEAISRGATVRVCPLSSAGASSCNQFAAAKVSDWVNGWGVYVLDSSGSPVETLSLKQDLGSTSLTTASYTRINFESAGFPDITAAVVFGIQPASCASGQQQRREVTLSRTGRSELSAKMACL